MEPRRVGVQRRAHRFHEHGAPVGQLGPHRRTGRETTLQQLRGDDRCADEVVDGRGGTDAGISSQPIRNALTTHLPIEPPVSADVLAWRVMNELTDLSASELAAMIRPREVSSREVDRRPPRHGSSRSTRSFNAITVVLADQARAAADAADRSEPSGPLHGVPITVKENIDLLGTPTTSGLAVLAEALPTANAAGRRPHAGRRRHPDRPHQPARARAADRHEQPAPRPHRQRMGPGADAWRVERRRGLGARVADVAARARQ